MTHDTGSTPRIPTEVPEVAKKPRAASDRATDERTTDTRAVDAGPAATGATGTARKPDDPRTGQPRMKAPAAAALPGDGIPPKPAAGPAGTPSTEASAPGATHSLFPDGGHDRHSERLQHAVSEFVESPRRAVEEAESTFDSVVDELTDALREYRHTLGTAGRDAGPGTRTEELRVTLQHYRDLTERLLNV
ncbi:hypothetical protein ACGFZA_14770 [Streptomyces sp. NPDC048211]|uniref:hypothetical protein n=1 Tax=Streptomyces sp. NPDC048211 TaxID=3365516 RepID=UPI003714179B